ncbi:hypothetical protein HSB1_10500 [Halogranum salarium B-1]|uniref:Uncharacterized protein n=1 Tax=Halogranum salarium B-1 TaxID=1210908 RepID=J3EYJ3_9EURY|nr:hypothetical protein HSB1_10500 [Halogranum salarium B-1]
MYRVDVCRYYVVFGSVTQTVTLRAGRPVLVTGMTKEV